MTQKTYDLIQKLLREHNIPEEFEDKLEEIVTEFEEKHAELKDTNHSAFSILLFGTVYKAGKESR